MANSFESPLEPAERPPTATQASGPFRLTLATIMIAVLAAAAASAMTVRVYRLFGAIGGGGIGIDLAALLLIAVILTATAIGSWRRSSLAAILVQITVCCAFVTGVLELGEYFPRTFRYAFQMWFAMLVALPLAMRRSATPDSPAKPRRPKLLALSEFLLSCGVNLLLVWIGILLQLILFEIMY